ncbi:MAG: complex I NDUFA9 subunit family protein [Alphaproteobacteria bacterium]|nr:complex I NDUFA9 subunit family protein [Alphaproteobacteria bacterium]
MVLNNKVATIFGGTGFLGRQIVRKLARKGYTIKVATRVPESAYFLRPAGVVGQIVPFACDYDNPESIAQAVRGADIVVNCIGILFQRGKRNTFSRVHVEIPARIAAAAERESVGALVHISALGTQSGHSKYAQSKREGEKAILANYPKAVILRPSVVFGEDDSFFNKFAEMARFAPVFPLIGGGKTKFQPVYVGDVAEAVMVALASKEAAGHIFELGGPEIVNFKGIYARLFEYTGRARALIRCPFFLAKIKAFFLNFLPNPPLTPDQVELLKTDSVVEAGAPGFAALGLEPVSMNLILPKYLKTYQPGGRFATIGEA